MPSRKLVLFAFACLTLAMLIGGASLWWIGRERLTTYTGTALVGGPFSMTDHTGTRVTDATYRGRYMLMFFGFTYCPDVCPTELQVMAQALDYLGPQAEEIVPIFVTVDPERDTPAVLKAYVENFSPRLVGLTGTAQDIAAMAKAYRVYYAKAGKTDTPDYTMDHTSIIYFMGRDGQFLKHFTYTTDAKALAEGLRAAMAAAP